MARGNIEMKTKKQLEIKSDIIIVDNSAKRFIFISDLHFDCYCQLLPVEEDIQKLKSGETLPDFEEDDNFLEREDSFIKFAKDNFSKDILLLAGDYYTDFQRTLSFVKRLEAAKIESYFVLGNHDFSSNNQTEFYNITKLFDSTTSSHEYCKFLMTGLKYYHEDVCIIGDTGWNLSNRIGPDSIMHIPPRIFERQSKKWIKFAKNVLAHEKQVLMVTHFPQADFPRGMSWTRWINWTDAKLLFQVDHCWKIFGHTHQRRLFQHYNNVCSQQGYKIRQIHSDYRDYNRSDFGILEKKVPKKSDSSFCDISAFNSLLPFYSTKIIQDPKKELQAVKDVARRGFKRVGHADNKRVIAAIISDKGAYIDHIKKSFNGIKLVEYMGYVLATNVSLKVINAVNNAIDILENADTRDVRAFMTAVVITGYVYNDMVHYIENMRPVDDYDIMRWYLVFATIKKYNLDPQEIKSVRKNVRECFCFQNVPVHLPKVNNKSLKLEEVRVLLSKTDLLPDSQLLTAGR